LTIDQLWAIIGGKDESLLFSPIDLRSHQMIGRRAVVSLSLLSALLFSAFAAQSASATKATNTTTFTCVKGTPGTEQFEDAHCDKPDY
jgi:hypothetical protein